MSTAPTRRSVLATGLTASASALLTGCAMGGSGGGGGETRELGGKDGKTGDRPKLSGTITVWSWDVAATAMKRLGRTFEARHPGTKIKVVDIGYDNAYDKITVGLRGGRGLPDVLTMEGSYLPRYTANFPTGFYDLAALGGRYGGDFDRAAWRTVTGGPDGDKVFALPWDIGPCALYHRADHLRAAGVSPDSLRTWDDYVKAGIRIKKATGHKLLVMDSTDSGILPMLLQQQGQSYFKGGRVALDTPAALKAMTVMRDLAEHGLVSYEKGWDGLVTATKEGKVATTPTAAWWTGTLTAEMPELKGKFGVVPLPGFTADGVRTSNIGGSALCVPAQTKNADLAWEFIRFLLTGKANQVSMLKREGLFPAYLPALEDPYLSEPQEYFGGQRANAVFARLAQNIPPVEYTDDDAKAGDIATAAVNAVMLRGKDPKAALASAADQLAEATKRKKVA
ncbi:ABC transporter substrate-binding protein [Streptomyces xanthii]|uniref:Sugar ABC transporter substrate-binding protein n=1 Tax=Streptomyces xanthii TaxID=2768069 RepID=A0A7H1B374_9ACTN|nr:sugar ABC transporter substrate-binding protein [Streptomyces xanthii]QNS03179.1 sugar ABC transporter substrate-binding protein [Streptomyces xanthii]